MAGAEAIKRQLKKEKMTMLVSGCGTGKTKIGSAALYAYQKSIGGGRRINVITCPSHVAKKWVRNNDTLKKISVMLGKYREIIADKRKNSFSYGLGEKYDITYGNDISNCLSSELALLGAPETEILFFKRYYEKHLQQYRKREPSVKGDGDIDIAPEKIYRDGVPCDNQIGV